MKNLRHTITTVISRGEKQLVAECVEVNVVTQGTTFDEVITNLQEAVGLFFEGEDYEAMGFVKKSDISCNNGNRTRVCRLNLNDFPERK